MNNFQNKVITRKILHPQIEIDHRKRFLEEQIGKEKYNLDDLNESICRAKNYLITERNFQRGHAVIIATSVWPEFLVWFLAVSELGGRFLILDSPSTTPFEIFQYRLEIYEKVDHFITPQTEFYLDIITKLGLDDIKILDHVYKYYVYKPEILDLVLARNSDTLITALSSGTTGKPKIVQHTHEFFYDLSERNAKIYGFHEDERCSHTKNLHHGSVVGVFLLPALRSCKYHVFYNNMIGDVERFTDSVINDGVHRIMLFSQYELKLFSNRISKNSVQHKLKIGILSEPNRQILQNLCGECDHELISTFGCTETSGPLFLQVYNKDNYETLEFNDFGYVLDDFYKISVLDESLYVEMPDGTLIRTGDKFTTENNKWYHKGRETSIKFKGVPLYIPLINAAIEECFKEEFKEYKAGINFDVAVDYDFLKIYLRSDFQIDLQKLNSFLENRYETEAYSISLLILEPRSNFMSGIKLDLEFVRRKGRESLRKT